MGATGWDYFTPYEADISAALKRLQADVFAREDYISGVGVAKSDVQHALKSLGSDLESALQTFAARAADPSLPSQTREKFAAFGEAAQ